MSLPKSVNRHSPIPPLRLLLPGKILKVLANEINHPATPPDVRRWLTQLLRELNKSDSKGSYPGFIRGRPTGVTAARLADRIEGELKKMTIELDWTKEFNPIIWLRPRPGEPVDWLALLAMYVFALPTSSRRRLQECRWCLKWFLARVPHQHSCGRAACRQAFYRHRTEGGRIKDREYRRKYNQRERAEQKEALRRKRNATQRKKRQK